MGRAISSEVVYSISATKNTYKAVINYQNKLLNKEGVVRYAESVLHVMEFDEEFCLHCTVCTEWIQYSI